MTRAGKIAGAGLVLAAALPALAFPPAPEESRGKKAVFMSADLPNNKFGIGIMSADGSGRTILSKHGNGEVDPALSPDGKRIAFAVTRRDDESRGIWVMNTDGSGRKKLIDVSEKYLPLSPAWSPDGKRIAYTLYNGDVIDVMVMDADGKNAKRVGRGLMPVFSPDGKKILYTGVNAADRLSLHLTDADGQNDKELVTGYSAAGYWSRDGRRIVYVGGAIKPHIYTCKADGSDPTQLTKGEEADLGAVWSADGKRIFFSRVKFERPLKGGSVWVMDADGKNEKQLTKSDGLDVLGGSSLMVGVWSGHAPKP